MKKFLQMNIDNKTKKIINGVFWGIALIGLVHVFFLMKTAYIEMVHLMVTLELERSSSEFYDSGEREVGKKLLENALPYNVAFPYLMLSKKELDEQFEKFSAHEEKIANIDSIDVSARDRRILKAIHYLDDKELYRVLSFFRGIFDNQELTPEMLNNKRQLAYAMANSKTTLNKQAIDGLRECFNKLGDMESQWYEYFPMFIGRETCVDIFYQNSKSIKDGMFKS